MYPPVAPTRPLVPEHHQRYFKPAQNAVGPTPIPAVNPYAVLGSQEPDAEDEEEVPQEPTANLPAPASKPLPSQKKRKQMLKEAEQKRQSKSDDEVLDGFLNPPADVPPAEDEQTPSAREISTPSVTDEMLAEVARKREQGQETKFATTSASDGNTDMGPTEGQGQESQGEEDSDYFPSDAPSDYSEPGEGGSSAEGMDISSENENSELRAQSQEGMEGGAEASLPSRQ
jgi:hypothetical protein